MATLDATHPWLTDPAVVAVVLDDNGGELLDACFNWESAQSYALSEGREVVAIRDDGLMSKDDIQRLCDSERARFIDCFGLEV